VRAALLVDGVGTTRKNDTLGLEVKVGNLGGAWEHLREDVELTETAGDPLQSLSAT